jgi:hypothetical protein
MRIRPGCGEESQLHRLLGVADRWIVTAKESIEGECARMDQEERPRSYDFRQRLPRLPSCDDQSPTDEREERKDEEQCRPRKRDSGQHSHPPKGKDHQCWPGGEGDPLRWSRRKVQPAKPWNGRGGSCEPDRLPQHGQLEIAHADDSPLAERHYFVDDRVTERHGDAKRVTDQGLECRDSLG